MRVGSDAEAAMIREAIADGDLSRLDDIRAVIESTGALQYAADKARQAADEAIRALNDIPESDWKAALVAIADFAVKRRS